MTYDPNDPRRIRDDLKTDYDATKHRMKNTQGRGVAGWILGLVIAGLLAFLLWPRGTAQQASVPNPAQPANIGGGAGTAASQAGRAAGDMADRTGRAVSGAGTAAGEKVGDVADRTNQALTGQTWSNQTTISYGGRTYHLEGSPALMKDADMAVAGKAGNGTMFYVPKSVKAAAAGGGGFVGKALPSRLYIRHGADRYQAIVAE